LSQLTFWILGSDTVRLRRWETALSREGWQVSPQTRFDALQTEVARERFGIVLLDWNTLKQKIPEGIRRLKTASAGLSVILTSDSDLGPDKVIDALEAGCDDHFIHDIDDRLLTAKLKAHLRRILPSLASALDVLKSPGGEIKLDRSRQEAWTKGTRTRWAPVTGLTPTEFHFLALFLEQPGKVLERAFILDSVSKGKAIAIRPGTVDKHIESLRRKLGRYGTMIKSVYGVGYALREN
jgi:DNA-binding response OmpR family regulator